MRSEQREFRSADGTTVRMFVITPDGPARPRPALVYGYGGFGISLSPSYTPFALAWVAAGGSYAVVSLRGGGEEGEELAPGRQPGPQAERLRRPARRGRRRWSTPATPPRASWRSWAAPTAGCWSGAALTQRPAAYRAVVCSAPLLDMVRYEEFSLGRTWNDEYGTAADPQELGWLLAYSPYHHVRPGTEYPAVLFTVFESDTRVDPLHARKMCAALQHATTGDPGTRPILLRRETDVGHGARSVSRTVALATDQLAFLAAHTGLERRAVTPTQLLPMRPACADDAGSWCARFYELTNNDVLSRSADAIVGGHAADHADRLVAAVLARYLLHRLIYRVVEGATGRGCPGWSAGLRRWAATGARSAAERSAQRARTIGSVLRSITSAVVWSVAAVMVLAEFSVNLAPILASAGIVGLAVGFGAQNLVRDFLSGMFMLLEDQYGVGDIVDVGAGVRRRSRRSGCASPRCGTATAPSGTCATARSCGWATRARATRSPWSTCRWPTAPTSPRPPSCSERVAAERVAEADIAEDVLEPPEVLGVERVDRGRRDAAGHRAGATRASSSPCSGR